MEIHILAQDVGAPPVLGDVPGPLTDLSSIPSMTLVVVEKGMASGEPSVLIVVSNELIGTVLLQTSLDKLISGVSGCVNMAETRWGWKRPEGHATIMPPDKATAKALLLAIEKELREWVDD